MSGYSLSTHIIEVLYQRASKSSTIVLLNWKTLEKNIFSKPIRELFFWCPGAVKQKPIDQTSSLRTYFYVLCIPKKTVETV